MAVTKHLQHVRSAQYRGDIIGMETRPVVPSSGDIKYGEIAINYHNGCERMFIRNDADEIVAFVDGDKVNSMIQNAISVISPVDFWNGEGDLAVYGGTGTVATGDFSFAHGENTSASGHGSHAEGKSTNAIGNYSHAEGSATTTSGLASHAEGDSTTATGDYSHAEGSATTSSGIASHAEGDSTTATGNYSHAEGFSAQAVDDYSHAEGEVTVAGMPFAHAEGTISSAMGYAAHAEGSYTDAGGTYSHAEGVSSVTLSTGYYLNPQPIGPFHEDVLTENSEGTHAEGTATSAMGRYSHAEGCNTEARFRYEHANGKFNLSTNNRRRSYTIFSVGVGSSDSDRRNGLTVWSDGAVEVYKSGTGGSVVYYNIVDTLDSKAGYKSFSNYAAMTGATGVTDGMICYDQDGGDYYIYDQNGSAFNPMGGGGQTYEFDNEPTAGSNNLLTSGTIYNTIGNINAILDSING